MSSDKVIVVCMVIACITLLVSFVNDPPGSSQKGCPEVGDMEELKEELVKLKEKMENCMQPDLTSGALLLSLRETVEKCQQTLIKQSQTIIEM